MNANAEAVTAPAENYGPNPTTESPEASRLFSRKRGALYSLRNDGSVYAKSLTAGWSLVMAAPEAAKVPERSAWFAQWRATCPPWAQAIRDIPSLDELEQQCSADGACETPTGHSVEPDGTGPDGVPSWLRIFRMI